MRWRRQKEGSIVSAAHAREEHALRVAIHGSRQVYCWWCWWLGGLGGGFVVGFGFICRVGVIFVFWRFLFLRGSRRCLPYFSGMIT